MKNFVELAGIARRARRLKKPASHRGVHTASIGPVTSATLREFGLPVDIEAREYTIPGLVAAIVEASKRMRGARSSAHRHRDSKQSLDFGGEAPATLGMTPARVRRRLNS